jgi:hypothetical protein
MVAYRPNRKRSEHENKFHACTIIREINERKLSVDLFIIISQHEFSSRIDTFENVDKFSECFHRFYFLHKKKNKKEVATAAAAASKQRNKQKTKEIKAKRCRTLDRR